VASFGAVYDACVLYPAPLRDLLVRLARTDLFRAHWTTDIHDEWMRNLLANRPDLTRERLRRTAQLMDEAVPDCLVAGYGSLIPALRLPDPDDRHVLAAAIACRAGVIVTYNQADFPAAALQPFQIEAQHPDEFVRHLFDLSPGAVCEVVRQQRAALKSPSRSIDELFETLLKAELTESVAALRSMRSVL
jgi:predicted nucleic acid-binding protein